MDVTIGSSESYFSSFSTCNMGGGERKETYTLDMNISIRKRMVLLLGYTSVEVYTVCSSPNQ